MEIWTDGACSPNPGIGGWGWHSSEGEMGFGGEMCTTNNRMEMLAILMALKALPDGASVAVYSDSQYCVKGMTVWGAAWKKRNWRKKGGEDMPNRDLWLDLNEQVERVDAKFFWVRGHNGDKDNELADELAGLGRETVFSEACL